MRFAIAVTFAAFAMLGSGSARATSATTDATDIWWNSQKSGMGFQLINTGTFIFATGFIYGQSTQPIWFYANLNLIETNPITYSGNLGVATGPHFGGPFDPNNVHRRVAGTMTFVLLGISSGQINYVIDGVAASEPVERQPLTLDSYGGVYNALVTSTASGCTDPANNGPSTFVIGLEVQQSDTQMQQTWTFSGGPCTFIGNYSQQGRMGTFVGPATASGVCSANETLTMFQMTNEPFMFMARFHESGNPSGCVNNGDLVALIPR